MTEATANTPTPKPSFLRRLVPLAAAIVFGAGGFFASWSGLIDLPMRESAAADAPDTDFDFVPIRGLSIPLGAGAQASQLLFSADIEVRAGAHADMTRMTPRFLDVLNGYLRALEPEEIEEPAALARLRAQMLRRLQIVAGGDHVRDLLITEFVLR